MSNMSYCRFENTVEDLRDCVDNYSSFENDPNENSEYEIAAYGKIPGVCEDLLRATEDGFVAPVEYKKVCVELSDLTERFTLLEERYRLVVRSNKDHHDAWQRAEKQLAERNLQDLNAGKAGPPLGDGTAGKEGK